MSLSLLALCFFIIAILYSTAGFGGGSSYIAILLLANLPFEDVRWIALICNVVVVSTSCWYFYKADILKPKKLLPLIILSIPLAFFGGTFRPETNTFKIVAAIALIGASVLMIIDHKKIEKKILSSPILSGIGGAIGLLSGFIGIGGGIFLSPVLHIIRWESAKVISAAASFFILVN
ncbi:MAG: putative membrane protein YfcA, partial [Saprospiraceae bacterium]